ncbi:MAG: hypothetical protein ABFS45_23600 [Pseudomonadota bacterium]
MCLLHTGGCSVSETWRDDMGLADWFSAFCSNIQVQDGGTISTRYKAITRRLNTDFWDTTSKHRGSVLLDRIKYALAG